ncbi:hypothetical protein DPMN_129939 [Dreissena polymorpha]|uniref:Uncharacterized protein n=1 Tax=Dreissena polymorpha TaxID=45954 RepID=A0A9D4JXW7_DREPO|nr:hypothetical protein DPMN_129939 [Dreissena polymorpha]
MQRHMATEQPDVSLAVMKPVFVCGASKNPVCFARKKTNGLSEGSQPSSLN